MNFKAGGKRLSWLTCIGLLLVSTFGLQAKTITVDCSKKSLNAALQDKADELTIEFSGVCAEDVVIPRGNVTLHGAPGAQIIGSPGATTPTASIVIRSVANVVLSAFVVNDADASGIEVRHSAGVRLENVSVQSARGGLLLLDGSSAHVKDSDFENNGSDGIGIWGGSSLTLEGTVNASSNGRGGILASGDSEISVERTGTTLHCDSNRFGILLQLGAVAQLESAGPTVVTAHDNQVLGLDLYGSASWSGWIDVSNTIYGVAVEGHSTLGQSPGELTVSGSQWGLYVAGNSYVTAEASSLTGNDFGLWVEDSTVEMSGTAITGSAAEDVHLEFGSRLTAWSSSADVVTCDGTVLTRGDISCPSPLSLSSRLKASSVAAGGTRLSVALPEHPFEP